MKELIVFEFESLRGAAKTNQRRTRNKTRIGVTSI